MAFRTKACALFSKTEDGHLVRFETLLKPFKRKEKKRRYISNSISNPYKLLEYALATGLWFERVIEEPNSHSVANYFLKTTSRSIHRHLSYTTSAGWIWGDKLFYYLISNALTEEGIFSLFRSKCTFPSRNATVFLEPRAMPAFWRTAVLMSVHKPLAILTDGISKWG